MNSLLKENLLGLKDKLDMLEKELETGSKEKEIKNNLDDSINEFIKDKDSMIVLNVGGKKFETKIYTLTNIKENLFSTLINSFLDRNEEIPKELFFDRGFTYFKYIMEYLRTKSFDFKKFNIYERDDLLLELDYYGLSQQLNINKTIPISVGWDLNASKAGSFTVEDVDKKIMRIHSSSCYTYFVIDKIFSNENFIIEFKSTVTQTDNFYYLGIINESYSLTSNCMCCNPSNSYYIQCNGTIHINSMEVKDDRISWFGGNVDISMKVLLREKQIYFSIPDKVELGPYNIVSGNNFRVVAGHCNSGNGELIISDCYEYE